MDIGSRFFDWLVFLTSAVLFLMMKRLISSPDTLQLALASMLVLLLNLSQAFAIDVAAVEKALKGNKTASVMDIQFLSPKQKEKIIVITSSLNASSVDMLMVFKGNQCGGSVRQNNGTGSFSLKCLDGSKLKSNFI